MRQRKMPVLKYSIKEGSPMTHKLSCPCCHVTTEISRYDRACSTTADYLVCPECDYTFLSPNAPAEAPSSTEA